MEDRTQKLLVSLIKEHIKTAQPVGSGLLVEKYNLGVSSATARNEMAVLEEAGYIYQPHTSAGRVPTEKAYQFYVDNFLSLKEPEETDQKVLKEAIKKLKKEPQQLIKALAKNVAEMSGGLIFVGFAPHNSFYTGISNLFSQPEFVEQSMVYDLSLVVDHLDEVMAKLFDLTLKDYQMMIGSKNPFGNMCSAVVVDYRLGKDRGIFGLLGPMRMDYDGNLGLVSYAGELINNL